MCGRIQSGRVFRIFQGQAREPPKTVKGFIEGRIVPPRRRVVSRNRDSRGTTRGNLPLCPGIVFELDRQSQRRKRRRLRNIGGSFPAAMNVGEQFLRKFSTS